MNFVLTRGVKIPDIIYGWPLKGNSEDVLATCARETMASSAKITSPPAFSANKALGKKGARISHHRKGIHSLSPRAMEKNKKCRGLHFCHVPHLDCYVVQREKYG